MIGPLRLLVAVVACGWSAWACAAPPHVLLVTADDLGFQVGCYGDRVATTPHLDALAAGGVRFTRGYVTQASCSPSRSSLLTGLYPHQTGQVGLADFGYSMHAPPPPLLPDLMKRAGYRTACVGKVHVAPEQTFRFDLDDRDSAQTCRPGHAAAFFRRLLDEKGADQPFFLYANLFDPHAYAPRNDNFPRDIDGSPRMKVNADEVEPFPFIPAPQRDAGRLRQTIADFYCGVNRLDERLGELLAVLRDRGLEDDTLVVFLSDNGPPFWRGKCNPTEGGTRVPFIVRWPRGIATPAVSDALVSSIDVLPTICAAAGIDPPAGLPGRSLLPVLRGETAGVRETLATEFTSHTADYFQPCRSLRDGRYKVTINLLAQPGFTWPAGFDMAALEARQPRAARYPAVSLFDLDADPWELLDLAAEPELRPVREQLLARLQAWREETDDPLLDPQALGAMALHHAQERSR